MSRLAILVACTAIVAAACTTNADQGVATLTDAVGTDDQPENVQTEMTTEEAVLAFAACMRDNGIEDFPDPEIADDGSVAFGLGGGGQVGDVDREALRTARNACSDLLEQAGIGPGAGDRTEIEDQLVEFAACLRDNGLDVPDPDFSRQPGAGGVFGGTLDPSDPDTAAALESCQDLFGGRIGAGAARGGGGAANGRGGG